MVSVDMGKITNDFRKLSGENYRIEKNKPNEKAEYDKLRKADRGNKEEITLAGYLKYLQSTKPGYCIGLYELEVARYIDQLKNDPDPEVRETAARILSDIGWNSYTVPALIETLNNDSDSAVVSAAADGLAQIGPKNIAMLKDPIVPALLEVLKNAKNKNASMRAMSALGSLGEHDGTVVPALIEIMEKNPDQDVRANAAWALFANRDKTAAPALIRTLKNDPYKKARGCAAMALNALIIEKGYFDKAMVPVLINAYKTDPYHTVQIYLGVALKHIKEILGAGDPLSKDIEMALAAEKT